MILRRCIVSVLFLAGLAITASASRNGMLSADSPPSVAGAESGRHDLSDERILRLLFGDSAQINDDLCVVQPDLGQTLSSTALVTYINTDRGHPLEHLRRGPTSFRFNPSVGESVSIQLGTTASSFVVSGNASGTGVVLVKLDPVALNRKRSDMEPHWPYTIRIAPDRVTISRVVRGVRESILKESKLPQALTGAIPFRLELAAGKVSASVGSGQVTASVAVESELLAAAMLSVGATDGPVTLRNASLTLCLHPEVWKQDRNRLAGRAVLEHVRRRDAQREMLVEVMQPTPTERALLRDSLSPEQKEMLDREEYEQLFAALPKNPIARRFRAIQLMRQGKPGDAFKLLGGREAPRRLAVSAGAAALAADKPDEAWWLVLKFGNTEGEWESDDARLIAGIASWRYPVTHAASYKVPVCFPSGYQPPEGSWLSRVLNGRISIERTGPKIKAPGFAGVSAKGSVPSAMAASGLTLVGKVLGCEGGVKEAFSRPDALEVIGIESPWDFADAMLVVSDQRADMLGGVFVPARGPHSSQILILDEGAFSEDMARVVGHEVTHAVIEKLFPNAAPLPWLNEGAAVLVSASTHAEDAPPEFHLPVEAQGMLAEVTAFLTGPEAGRRIRELVRLDRETFYRRERVALNYAVSWALIWYAASQPEGFALNKLLSGELNAAELPSEQLGRHGNAAAEALNRFAEDQ